MAGVITKAIVVAALTKYGPIAPKELVGKFKPYLSDKGNPHYAENRSLFRVIIDEVSEVSEDKTLRLKPSLATAVQAEAEAPAPLPPAEEAAPEATPTAAASSRTTATSAAAAGSRAVSGSGFRRMASTHTKPESRRHAAKTAPPAADASKVVAPTPVAAVVAAAAAAQTGEDDVGPIPRAPNKSEPPANPRKESIDYMNQLWKTRQSGGSNVSLLSNTSADFCDDDFLCYTDVSAFRAARIRHFYDHDMETSRRHPVSQLSTDMQKRWLRRVIAGDNVEARMMLASNPELVNHRDIFTGFGAIHWAAKQGNVKLLELLNSCDALDVDLHTHGGMTALHLANQHEQLQAISVLKTFGARSLYDTGGRLPEDLGSRRRSAMPIMDAELDLANVPTPKRGSSDWGRSRANTAPSTPGRNRGTSMSSKISRKSNRLLSMFKSDKKQPSVPNISELPAAGMDSPGPPAPLTTGVLFSPPPGDIGFQFEDDEGAQTPSGLDASRLSTTSGARSPLMKRLDLVASSMRRSRRGRKPEISKPVASPEPRRSRSMDDVNAGVALTGSSDGESSTDAPEFARQKSHSLAEIKIAGVVDHSYNA